jgi:hypothetical protein
MAKQSSRAPAKPPVRRNRTEPIGNAIGRITKPVFGRRGMADGVIARDWRSIVGEAIAKHSQPEKISYPGRERAGGLLHLRVDNSAMATQLQHLEPQLVERINGHFGYRAVARLRFIHGPLPEPVTRVRTSKPLPDLSPARRQSLDATLKGVDDPDLAAALERLGRAIGGAEPDA